MNNSELSGVTSTNTERLPRMRTLKQAYELLKEEDPDTGITMKEIRRIIENDEIEVYCVGRKKLINVDLLFAKLMCYYNCDNRVSSPSLSIRR